MGCIVLVVEVRITRAFTKVLRDYGNRSVRNSKKNCGALRRKVSERLRSDTVRPTSRRLPGRQDTL